MKVLIVDDSKMSQMVLHKFFKTIFGEDKIDVKFAFTGEEAVEFYQSFRPNICTIDIVMAGMDGIQASKKINIDNPNAKIIIVTSTEQKLDDFKDIPAIKAVVIKPITLEKVTNALKLAKVLK